MAFCSTASRLGFGRVIMVLSLCASAILPIGRGLCGEAQTAAGLQRALAGHLGARDAVMVSAADGTPLVEIHADLPLVPASILKILTASAALETLGSDYTFRTDFLVDQNDNLKIKGYGDPLLVSERLDGIARTLAEKRRQFKDILLDDTFFDQPLKIPGRGTSKQPYDAPNGALCVNFNTVAFDRAKGRWVSAEPQTPLLPSVIDKIESSGLDSGRITLAADSDEALLYTGQLFRYFLDQAGIRISGTIQRGTVSYASDRMLWQYRSTETLSHVISALLEFSNNFIANQLLLVMGAAVHGPPATVEKGLDVLSRYYETRLGISTGRIAEASGISRLNRMTARAMITILDRFETHYQLLRHTNGQFYKTGHLRGVRTRAGYIVGRDGSLYRFVVMVNTPGKTTHRIIQAIEARVGR